MSNRPNSRHAAAQRAREGRGGSGTPVWLWVVAAVILVVALGVAVLATGGDDTDDAGDEVVTGSVTVSEDGLPKLDPTGPDEAVGMPAPSLSGRTYDDEPIEVDPEDGPMVLVFLAHWCGHCQNEVPRIQAWLDEHGDPDGVELVSVSTSVDPDAGNYPPGQWLEDEGWTVPVVVDDEASTAAEAFGLPGFPYFVAVGPDGEVVERTSGELSVEQFEALLDAARSGSPAGLHAGGASGVG